MFSGGQRDTSSFRYRHGLFLPSLTARTYYTCFDRSSTRAHTWLTTDERASTLPRRANYLNRSISLPLFFPSVPSTFTDRISTSQFCNQPPRPIARLRRGRTRPGARRPASERRSIPFLSRFSLFFFFVSRLRDFGKGRQHWPCPIYIHSWHEHHRKRKWQHRTGGGRTLLPHGIGVGSLGEPGVGDGRALGGEHQNWRWLGWVGNGKGRWDSGAGAMPGILVVVYLFFFPHTDSAA